MGERELREKYGGKLAKAINRAIRAEIPGGNEALEKLTQLAGAARQSHWEDKQGRPTPEAAAYLKHQRDVVERMEAQVRGNWGVPPARETKPKAASHSASPRGGPLRSTPPRGGPLRGVPPRSGLPRGAPTRRSQPGDGQAGSAPRQSADGRAGPQRGAKAKPQGRKPVPPARRKGSP